MIWEFADLVGRRLLLWATLSVAVGVVLVLSPDAFVRGIGTQAIAWGAIDGLIGLVGRRGAARDRRRAAGGPAAAAAGRTKLRRLLLLNAGLDVGYVAVGLWLLAGPDAADPFLRGSGAGVVVQGGFLLVFDALHARWIPQVRPLLPPGVEPYAGDEHRPYRLAPAGAAEPAAPAALLVHGFAGSPAELRPLADALAEAGWTVEGPLLPGMGPDLGAIAETEVEAWTERVAAAAAALRADGDRPLVLIGYSMGAALVLEGTERIRPDAVVLLNPFWLPQPAWQRPVTALVRTLLPPGVRPFARVDFDRAEARRGVEGLLPGLDLDDPAVRTAVRELVVPTVLFERLLRLSRRARTSARSVTVPVLAVQGTRDEVATPARTEVILAELPVPPERLDVEAGHDLLGEPGAVRERVVDAVLGFVAPHGPGTARSTAGGGATPGAPRDGAPLAGIPAR